MGWWVGLGLTQAEDLSLRGGTVGKHWPCVHEGRGVKGGAAKMVGANPCRGNSVFLPHTVFGISSGTGSPHRS